MDRMLNSKREKESIYEIYRACRLCGGGAGYKMPIIQNIVDLDETEVELKQKIRDCVQIEVHQDDKMPPLICELCVDKVNDFYEFLEMCRQTNKRTRLRLGLPPQSLPRGAPDAGECILGLTEPVFVNEDSDGEPLSKHKKLNKTKVKKEPVVRIKIEELSEERLSRAKVKRPPTPPTPPRVTRHSKSKDDDVSPNKEKEKSKPSKMAPKSILKKENPVKTNSSPVLSPRLKRSHEKEPAKLETPPKKVKIAIKPPPTRQNTNLSPKSSPKSSPRLPSKNRPEPKPLRPLRSPPVAPKRPPSPPKEDFACTICGQQNKSGQARGNHMRSHTVTFTSHKLACNPCGVWFVSMEEALYHQKSHRNKNIPYNCRRCQADFKRMMEFEQHLENNECLPSTEVPDVKCEVCWHLFPTNNLLDTHKCLGEDHRPGGKCSKCNRSYALMKNLKKHETTCTAKKKGDFVVDKKLLDKLKPFQVRVARCDPLLTNVKQEHYDVSSVSYDYGLDSTCYYPYISSFPGMVNIHTELKEFCSEDYIHWDSEDTDDGEEEEDISCQSILNPTSKKKSVDSLAALTLKTIFSSRFLGKVPKKKRKLKAEKVFDTLLGENDDVGMDIGNIIDNLGNDNDKNDDSVKVSNLSSLSDTDMANDSVNESFNDKANDSTDNGNGAAKDSDTDFNDSNSHVSFNDSDKPNVVSSLDNSVQTNKMNDNSTDFDKNNDTEIIKNNDDKVLTNNANDNELLNNLDEDSNSQSLLENLNSKSNDSEQNSTPTNNISEKDSLLNKNNESSDKEKVSNNDTKNINSESNAAIQNDNSELRISKNVENNGSGYKNDSKPNDSLDKIDAQINDSDLNNKVNDENNDSNDKIVLEDLLSKSTESKIGLGSIEDYSFES